MIFLVQFGINEHLLIFFKDHKLHSPHGLVQFLVWKNLLALTYSKLRSKSCDYVYLFQLLVQ